MTVDDVKRAVAAIAACAGDDEAAHEMEDDLHRAVLAAIAAGEDVDPPADLCREAMKTRELKFSRWYN